MAYCESYKKKIADEVQNVLDEKGIKYEKIGYCFGTEWDKGTTFKLKTKTTIFGNTFNTIDVHDGVNYLNDTEYSNRIILNVTRDHEITLKAIRRVE